MPSRHRLRRLKDKLEDLFRDNSPTGSTTSLQDMRQPSPLPQALSHPVTPVPSTAATSTQIDAGSKLLPPLTASISSQATATPTTSVLPSPAPDSKSSVPDPAAPLGLGQTVSSNEGTSKERVKSMAWSGLKTLLKVVDASSDVFPPLKSAVGGLSQCIDIFESASKGRKDYAELQSKLDSLLKDLSQYLDGPAGLTMTASMKNLAMGIDEELKLVLQKAQRGSGQRPADALEDADEIMECYRKIQGHLERLSLNANLSIWRLVDEQATSADLREKEERIRRLSPTMAAEYNSAESEDVQRGPCTPGTRQQELAKLRGWLYDRSAGDVYWMNGMAGTGKTTIAYSLCDELDKTAKLGASFFCSRLIPECRNVKLILPAIAYQLARFSRPFRHELSRVLEADPDAHTRVLKTQFESLLVKPLMEVKNALPADFMVVIDALDECENENSVGQILDVLLSQTVSSDLPIRFLVSSRPEPEIFFRMMSRVGHGFEARLVLHELDAKTVNQDIGTYLRAELETVPLTDLQIAALIEQSGVLFIFAATAARYLKDGSLWMDHNERLETILGSSATDRNGHNIDSLYSAILNSVFQNRKLNSSNRTIMKTILDTVICAQEPMPLSVLDGLLRLKNAKQVDGLLRPLYSVVNISEATGLVTTLHASFPDFMLDRRRSSIFHCNSADNHARLAKACFKLIKTNVPQFNICGFQSSYVCDDQVADLGKLVDNAVSLELFYACRHWSAHLESSEWHVDLGDQLFDFLSKRLLLWMEVLNLKKSMHLGPRIILRAEAWSRANNRSIETTELAHEAWCFAMRFIYDAASQSTPHLYISMLQFWPESSPISKHYAKRMGGAIAQGTAISRRQLALMAAWSFDGGVPSARFSADGSLIVFGVSSSVFVIDATTGRTVVGPLEHESSTRRRPGNLLSLRLQRPVNSVAFSPDGSLIVSGSADGTIRVWSALNGQSVGALITGHTGWVNSICFSPDGRRIASGSSDMTVCIWDVKSGQMVIGPLRGHTQPIYSVSFSPDGTRLASGSLDETSRVWDAEKGLAIAGPLRGHTHGITSISFSRDGTRIVSGSFDHTIQVWDIQSGDVVGPLEGHTDYIHSISFSFDNRFIVSGSADRTIRLWDLNSNPISVRTLEGHTGAVTSVSFSSDGSRIVSCSDDKTIRVWDTQSRATIADSLGRHTKAVTSVGFSPDSTRIVSGSSDKTIRMWDAQSGRMVGGPLEGHTDSVISICFSPDGTRLFSGGDTTVRGWNVQSGQEVVGPLKGHTDLVFSICLSPDGALIASGSKDKTIRVWKAQNGRPVGNSLKGHRGSVNSVCFSPDNTRIVSGSADRTVRVWDVRSGQTITGPLEEHTDVVRTVCFSPDGTRLASGSRDKTIQLWDAQSGEAIVGLEGHTSAVSSVCFSPDGTVIVSGSGDKTLRLWDAQSGQAIGVPLVGHTSWVSKVAFSPDGRHMVSGSEDQTIRVWDVRGILGMVGMTDLLTSHSIAPTSSPGPHEAWDLREDGWLVDSQSRLLAWVPLDLHDPPPRPHSLVISTKGSLKIDIDSANLGESWADSHQSPSC